MKNFIKNKKIQRLLSIALLCVATFVSVGLVVYAISLTKYRVDLGITTKVDEWSICKRVVNNNNKTLFVGTKTKSEWESFIAKKPNDVSLVDCSVNYCKTHSNLVVFYNSNNPFNCPAGVGTYATSISCTPRGQYTGGSSGTVINQGDTHSATCCPPGGCSLYNEYSMNIKCCYDANVQDVPLVDLKANLSDLPITVNSGSNISLSWYVTPGATQCKSVGWASGGATYKNSGTNKTCTTVCAENNSGACNKIGTDVLGTNLKYESYATGGNCASPYLNFEKNGTCSTVMSSIYHSTWGCPQETYTTSCLCTIGNVVSTTIMNGSSNIKLDVPATSNTYTLTCDYPSGTVSDTVTVSTN